MTKFDTIKFTSTNKRAIIIEETTHVGRQVSTVKYLSKFRIIRFFQVFFIKLIYD